MAWHRKVHYVAPLEFPSLPPSLFQVYIRAYCGCQVSVAYFQGLPFTLSMLNNKYDPLCFKILVLKLVSQYQQTLISLYFLPRLLFLFSVDLPVLPPRFMLPFATSQLCRSKPAPYVDKVGLLGASEKR